MPTSNTNGSTIIEHAVVPFYYGSTSESYPELLFEKLFQNLIESAEKNQLSEVRAVLSKLQASEPYNNTALLTKLCIVQERPENQAELIERILKCGYSPISYEVARLISNHNLKPAIKTVMQNYLDKHSSINEKITTSPTSPTNMVRCCLQ